jgi:uncharacterized membrane protein
MKKSVKPHGTRSDHAAPKTRYALDAHHRVFFGCVLAAIAVAVMHGRYAVPTQLVVAWNVFSLTLVVLAWVVITTKDPYEARRNARLQDSSATFLFSLIVTAATASLLAVGLLLGSAKGLAPTELAAHLALSVSAVFFSWALVHTIFALRYAHFYFWNAREVERHKIEGGLAFPGKCGPDYMDFAYFSFVIGMTCQVSDVQITSTNMRRLALIHGLISFAFNTAILAMFVNIIAGLV